MFEREDYDEGNTYYCTYKAPKRPLCMSTYMHECPNTITEYKGKPILKRPTADYLFDEMYKEWKEWSEDKYVCANGICNKYKKRRNKNEI